MTREDGLTVTQISEISGRILDEVSSVVVGMEATLKLALAAILASGHILFEDVPGVGKTVAARSIAEALGLDFTRLQCTPDLLPSDITGSMIFNPLTRDFLFRPGPVFTGILLADEINRTGPKTQSALLEAMAERHVSIEGTTHDLPLPFHVIATSNPIELEGTYPLPEAQMDRFMVRLSVGYPSSDQEADILRRRMSRKQEQTQVAPVVDAETVRAMQRGVEQVSVDDDIVAYCVSLAAATRTHPNVDMGVSPRGSQSLMLVARSLGVLDGREYTIPEDVKAAAVAVLTHRIALTPSAWAEGVAPTDIIREIVGKVPGPSVTGKR